MVVGQVGRGGFVGEPGQHAAIADPLAGPGQTRAHQPAAALGRATGQSDHGAVGQQVAADIVDGGHRQMLGAGIVAGGIGHAGRGLHHRVVTAPRPPRAFVAPGAERDVDHAGAQFGHLVRSEAAAGERPGTIGLGENVAGAGQLHQLGVLCLLPQVQTGGQFADAGVQVHLPRIGQPDARDLQHVRPMFRQGPRRGGAGDDAGQVQHPNTG